MDDTLIVNQLGALAQRTRLQVFRTLIEAGSDGLPATEIAERLSVRQNLMSTHLRVLSEAGLTVARRDGRRIYHAVDMGAVQAMLSFILSDCCHGHPEICGPVLEGLKVQA